MMEALAGIRVLDPTPYIPGPCRTMRRQDILSRVRVYLDREIESLRDQGVIR
jgi:hypothetical protein